MWRLGGWTSLMWPGLFNMTCHRWGGVRAATYVLYISHAGPSSLLSHTCVALPIFLACLSLPAQLVLAQPTTFCARRLPNMPAGPSSLHPQSGSYCPYGSPSLCPGPADTHCDQSHIPTTPVCLSLVSAGPSSLYPQSGSYRAHGPFRLCAGPADTQ
jgi:hypothetical protein